MKKILALTALIAALSSLLNPTLSHARVDESGPGNGTDYVKVLFAEAQFDLLKQLAPIGDSDLATLELAPAIRTWLLARATTGSRFDLLKSYVRKMELTFQAEPCSDFTGKPASICFFNDPAEGPYVVISLEENKMTSREQAMAMLIHEAGHFTGEKDHLFLDQVGIQLVKALATPELLIADAQSTELVANIFLAKDQCDAGTSQQAQILKQQALTNLHLQCAQRSLPCDLSKTEFIYKGELGYKEGSGFNMKVTCSVRAALSLRDR